MQDQTARRVETKWGQFIRHIRAFICGNKSSRVIFRKVTVWYTCLSHVSYTGGNTNQRIQAQRISRRTQHALSSTDRLGGLVVRRPTVLLAQWLRCPPRKRKIRGSIPACDGIFPGQVKPVATLPGARRYRVSAWAGWPRVGCSVNVWDSKFALQLLSQCGKGSNCLCRSAPETQEHADGTFLHLFQHVLHSEILTYMFLKSGIG